MDSDQHMSGETIPYNSRTQPLSPLYQDLYKYDISSFLFRPLIVSRILPYSAEPDISEAKQVFSCPYTPWDGHGGQRICRGILSPR